MKRLFPLLFLIACCGTVLAQPHIIIDNVMPCDMVVHLTCGDPLCTPTCSFTVCVPAMSTVPVTGCPSPGAPCIEWIAATVCPADPCPTICDPGACVNVSPFGCGGAMPDAIGTLSGGCSSCPSGNFHVHMPPGNLFIMPI